MKKIILGITIISSTLISSCGGSEELSNQLESVLEEVSSTKSIETMNFSEIDLSNKGIPITIMAPEDAEISSDLTSEGENGLGLLMFTVAKGKYSVSISMDTDESFEEETIQSKIASQKQIDTSFDTDEIVETFEQGYIFKSESNYGFYYVIEKNGEFIEFTPGLIFEDLSKKEVELILTQIKKSH